MPCPTARPSRFALAIAGAALLLLALPALADQVYQWKDAKGVTHYSDSPPPNQTYQNRDLRAKPATTVAKPAVNANCSNARSNLTVLKGAGPVGLDANRDGKHERELTAAERAERTRMAEAAVKTYCEGAAVVSPP